MTIAIVSKVAAKRAAEWGSMRCRGAPGQPPVLPRGLEHETSGAGEAAVEPSPTPAELQRTVVQLQREVEQLKTPRPVRRDDAVSEASASGAIPRHEFEAALAEKTRAARRSRASAATAAASAAVSRRSIRR